MTTSPTIPYPSHDNFTDVNCPRLLPQLYYGSLFVAAWTLNLALLHLINRHTKGSIQMYVMVLKTSVFADLYSSTAQWLVQMRSEKVGEEQVLAYSLDGLLPRLLHQLNLLQDGSMNYLIWFEYVGLYFTWGYNCAPFVYRYFLLCWDHKLRPHEFAVLCFVILAISATTATCIAFPSAAIYSFNTQMFEKASPECAVNLPVFDELVNGPTYPRSLALYRVYSKMIDCLLYTFIVTLVCSVRISYFLYKHTSQSREKKRTNRQITAVLFFQALMPFLVNGCPVLVMNFVAVMLRINMAITFKFYMLAFMATPVVNPLIAILCISGYRRALLSRVRRPAHTPTTVLVSRVTTENSFSAKK